MVRRRGRYGPNRLRTAARRSAPAILVRQFASLIMALLAAAAAVALVMGDWVEAVAILVVIVINTALGFVTELKAVRSMEALRRLGQAKARVRRAGEIRQIAAAELVPGDIVLVEGGDMLSADVRLIDASGLQTNESALTGESAPVDKSVEPVAPETPLAERRSMLYKAGSGVRSRSASHCSRPRCTCRSLRRRCSLPRRAQLPGESSSASHSCRSRPGSHGSDVGQGARAGARDGLKRRCRRSAVTRTAAELLLGLEELGRADVAESAARTRPLAR